MSHLPAISGRECASPGACGPPCFPAPRHIEVKGRLQGASTVTITRNEMLYACNQGDKFLLAIALIGDNDQVDGPYYLRNPFDSQPVNFDRKELPRKAQPR